MNTVLFDEQIAEAERMARQVIDAGAAALIVQDFAYMRMGLGGVEMHASTQMCNHDAEWVNFLSDCGFTRVILERNMSFDDIRRVAGETDVDLECFVHGAVCVGVQRAAAFSAAVWVPVAEIAASAASLAV